jgi:glycosyltransferase involved in cell wall biosynthesis
MLTNALLSVKNSTYSNWELCVIDDGIKSPAIEEIDRCFSLEDRIKHRISYIQTMDCNESKRNRGGSQFGLYANSAMMASDADIVIMLCDDDMLAEDYMERLNDFYLLNQDVKYSYCHLRFYNPKTNDFEGATNDYTDYLNAKTYPINPVRELDSSQVTWRRRESIGDNILLPHPKTSNLDEDIFRHMYAAWGNCVFNGIVGQLKGIHEDQLIHLKTNSQ